MNIKRFYHSPIKQPIIEISGTEAHHITNVMRLSPGTQIEIFDGLGTLAKGVIGTTSKKMVIIEISDLQKLQQRQTGKVTIVASIAKTDRFDWLISKCTELGVDRICPAIFDRTVKQPKNPKIIDRFNNLAISAAKQCKSLFIPEIDRPAPLESIIAKLKQEQPNAWLITGSLEKDTKNIKQIISETTPPDYIAIIGPEGGITEAENQMLSDNNSTGIKLTNTILRTETAAIAIATILCTARDQY
ncbi:MAG: 16S rRNA (uracil(1498)-N(3))-methyltransferase [Phycisphaerae bacterium]|nr:16S rRNA (uracil(1498)-N(3))-methyltransferase [Phycisphaerae bacterium]